MGYEFSNGLRGQPCLLAAGDFTDLHTKVVRLCLPDFSMLHTNYVNVSARNRTVLRNEGLLTNATNTTALGGRQASQNRNASASEPELPMETPGLADNMPLLWPFDRAWEAVLPTNNVGTEQEALVLALFS